ncbi:S8 family serine peptidase [Paenibacillus sp. sptzw28]|uniref:S8 family serine peptidase n=1 Tax=Paenibacillus sp. sptzw28 TaxID=715179 RepID=UPI001C6E63FE|nr:S8 family serine peptidase [Paenibacillus sp. sptzw28]QYR19433.1 S8 family serine peptidase [Paenibacillus sp. sptzw28]
MRIKMQTGIISKAFGVMMVLLLLSVNLAAAAPAQSERHSYLVGLKPGASSKALEAAGIQFASKWDNLDAVNIIATDAAIQGLARNPKVSYIEEDRPVYKSSIGSSYTDGAFTWGLQAVHAEQAWNVKATGQDIKVCVLDTGIDYGHPEFTRNGQSIIKASKNFVADGHPDATDGDGHGTHVAGTIAGQTSDSGSRIGAAPGVDLYVARVLGDDGSGTTSSVLNGLNWCQENKANIANLSLGSDRPSQTERKAFDLAYKNGMLSIAASGNDGSGKIGYPANYSSVVAVGAVDSSLNLAGFSNYGKGQELVAPGVGTLSSVPRGTGLHGITKENENGVETSYRSYGIEYAGLGSAAGPMVECGLADSASSCSGKPASGAWIALIDRGSITFGEKIQNVTAQGASAAIIVNNDAASPDDPGNFTLGSAGSWIPSVSVSYDSGIAIRSGGLGAGSVDLSAWDYSYFEGTSMATPHVSAVAALAWSANPGVTNDQIRTILHTTAQDLGPAGQDNQFGYGLVQADAAVQMARGGF